MESSAIKGFLELMPKPLTKCARVSWQFLFLSKVSYSKFTFLTRNSLFLHETHFYNSKLAFLTRNSLSLLETHFSYSKLAFLTRNSLSLLETYFSYSKLAFLTRNSLFLLETQFSYAKLPFLTRNSLFLLETRFSREHSIWQLLSDDGYPKRCHTCYRQIFGILASVCS